MNRKEEGRAEGRVEGMAEGTLELLEELGEVSETLRNTILEQKDVVE